MKYSDEYDEWGMRRPYMGAYGLYKSNLPLPKFEDIDYDQWVFYIFAGLNILVILFA